MHSLRPYQPGPLTPQLDPIPDDYEEEYEPSPSQRPQQHLAEPFGLLTLDEEEETNASPDKGISSEKSSLEMPRPWPFTSHHSAPTSLMTTSPRPLTPPKSKSSTQYLPPHHQISTLTPTRYIPDTSNSSYPAPHMVRAHSSPTVYTNALSSSVSRSRSPLRSPKRVRSPLRHVSADDVYAFNSARAMSPEIPIIAEDAPLEITPRSRAHPHSLSFSVSSTSTNPYSTLTFPRPLRRRPTSPMRSIGSSRASSVPVSPLLPPAAKFNESFPPDLHYSRSSGSLATSSSVPSTPTSARSRSPSISSLETIPDTPDAERRAVEQDRADSEDRQRLWEMLGGPGDGQNGSASVGGGSTLRGGFGSRDKRKRWSVCGAEKRSDLNLETIWED